MFMEGIRSGLHTCGLGATPVDFIWLETEPPCRCPEASNKTPPFDSWLLSLPSEQWLVEWPASWRKRVINLFHGAQCQHIPTVAVDDYRVGTDAAQHFATEGCQNAGIVYAAGDYAQQLRQQGFCEFWRAHHSTAANAFTQTGPALALALQNWLHASKGRKGIFVADRLPLQTVRRGLSDAAPAANPLLLAFHNPGPSQRPLNPNLAGCQMPLKEMGEAVGKLLFQQWRGQSLDGTHLKIPPRWEWGASGLATRAARLAVAAERTLQAHMGEADFSIDSLCQQLATPRRSLEVAFRERFDTSPSQYLQSLRLKSAADLLQNSPLRIVEIASQCGYSSQHHFSYAFKARYGSSPRDYRKSSCLLNSDY